MITQLAEAFAGRCVTLTGETGMADRQQAVDDFQAGKVPLFIGNIQAAGVGITLTRSSTVIFAELDWVPGNLSQAEDRCHRIGQTESVLVQHVVLEGSLDADMARKLTAKQDVIDRALDTKAEAKPTLLGQQFTVDLDRRDRGETAKTEQRQAEEDALTPEQVAAVHGGLRRLAGMCDGAVALDGCGFNKLDADFGHRLASLPTLTPRQALAGRRLCVKYRRQLGAEFQEKIGAGA